MHFYPDSYVMTVVFIGWYLTVTILNRTVYVLQYRTYYLLLTVVKISLTSKIEFIKVPP